MASAQCHLGLPLACSLGPNDGVALFHFGRLPYCSGALGVGVPARPIGRASAERPLYAQCLFSREL